MLIKENNRENIIEVYGVYWIKTERIYWVIPYDGYEGFITLSEKETTVIDSSFKDTFVLRKNDAGEDLFLHWAADKGDLIYDLIEHDPEAMKEFKRRIAEKNP